jgi:two-component system, NarL family, sensor kinase
MKANYEQLIREIKRREQIEEALKERLKFETLLAELSAHFVNLPADRIDSNIEDAQRRICELLDLDRSTLWQMAEREPGTLLLTHIHRPSGSLSPPERMNGNDLFPWITQKVLKGEAVILSKLTDLPPKAVRDRENLLAFGTKSDVVVPLSVGEGPVFGMLTFAVMGEERSWPETVVKGFKIIAQVFANALARKRSDQLLRESAEVNRVTFDQAAVGIAHVGIDGHWLRVNDKLCAIVGYPREELLQLTFQDITYPDDLEIDMEYVRQVLSGEIKTYSIEKRYFRKDRSLVWINLTVSLVHTAAGEPAHFISVVEDITARKRAEQALEDRLSFERLLSDLSARFVNIPPDRVDSEIEHGLKQTLEFFQVDRCELLRLLPGKASWQITHIATSGNVPTHPAGVELPGSLYPWAYEKLAEKHEVMSVSRLDDLPAEANVDRQSCTKWGIRSYVNIPILVGDSVTHIIHVSSVQSERVWPEELFPRLRLLGEIFVNGLERKRAEEASRESERMLRQNESELRELAGRLIYAQEEERSRLARELHDDLAQRLAVVAIDVGRLELQLTDPPAPVREELREMKNGIVRISQDVHSLSRQLHPSILDDLGLIKAAESECAGFSRREGIEVLFNHENIPRVIPKDVSLSLYRIIQEGLRNISKHACAEHASVSLQGIDHGVLLSVQDDGIGFDWAEAQENPGLGFSSMRERVRLIQGELSIKSEPEKGTVITVRAPLTRKGE